MDARQLATQQQNFINQQALILVRVGMAPGLPSRDRSVEQGQASSYLAHPLPLPLQAQQMTAQAMSLSLEQQTQQRQRQAQAPGATSSATTPAISPKPKKPPAPQEEPELELEPVGACLRVRSRDLAKGGAWERQQAPGLWGWETWGWR